MGAAYATTHTQFWSAIMDLGQLIFIIQTSIIEILILAGPILIVSVFIGLVISILQAITSIQEQTLTFVPKILGILILLAVLGPFLAGRMLNFTTQLWSQLTRV